MKFLVCAMFVFSAMSAASASSIPIWDLLSREEKMGRLFYVFVHLVEQYCKTSDIPDCSKVLTLYGMSNLVNDDELELNSLDPYQKNSRAIIWAKIMRGEFKQSTKDVVLSVSQHLDANDDDEGRSNNVFPSSPYEVRVKPPAGFTYNPSDEVRRSQRPIMLGSTKYDSDLDNSATKLSNNVVLLRPGRGQRSRRSVNRRSILLKSLSSK